MYVCMYVCINVLIIINRSVGLIDVRFSFCGKNHFVASYNIYGISWQKVISYLENRRET